MYRRNGGGGRPASVGGWSRTVIDRSPVGVVEQRTDVLRTLDRVPKSTATLVERLDVSRSTVDRSLRELTTLGFVASTPDGYRLTLSGRLALDEHDRRGRRIGALAGAAPLFEPVDPHLDLDPAVVDDGTVVEATPHAPHRPVERVVHLVEGATHVSVYVSRFLSRHARIFHERVTESGMTCSIVMTDRVVERARSERAADLREVIDRGRVDVRRTDREHGLSLFLAETPDGPEMGLLTFRDDTPLGFVGNDDPVATRWARGFHERLWAAATPVEAFRPE